jgi:hypothetical protein
MGSCAATAPFPEGERLMRKFIGVAGLAAISIFAVCAESAGAAPAKGNSGTIVIVFKDGHRQTFNLSDIERVEFPAPARVAEEIAPSNPQAPPRGHYVGRWECGDGAGSTFYIDLKEDGSAWRSIGNVRGHWEYVNGEAHATWDDGAKDAIRKVGSHYEKSAYEAGKSFSDQPANVTHARLTNPKPI